MHLRLNSLVIHCGYLIFAFVLGLSSAGWTETSQPEFKITDMPVVDIREFQITMNMQHNMYSQHNNSGSLVPAYASGEDSETYNYLLRIAPRMEHHTGSIQEEMLFTTTLDVGFSLYNNEYQTTYIDTYGKKHTDNFSHYETVMMSCSPMMKYTAYLEKIYVGGEAWLKLEQNNRKDRYRSLSTNASDPSEYERSGETEEYLVYLQPMVYLGNGRIYDGRYASQALQIVSDLKSHQLLRREPDKKDLRELSALISRLRNRYYFDYRQKSISDIKRLVETLVAQGCLRPDDIEAALVLQDTYFNVFNESRDFGFLWNARLGGIFSLNNQEIMRYESTWTTNQYEKAEPIYLYGFVGLESKWALPVDQKWQLNAELTTDYYAWEWNNAYIDQLPAYLEANLHLSAGYYFNTRFKVELIEEIKLLYDVNEYSEWKINDDYMINYHRRQVENVITLSAKHNLNENLVISANLSWGIQRLYKQNYQVLDWNPLQNSVESLARWPVGSADEVYDNWSASLNVGYLIY